MSLLPSQLAERHDNAGVGRLIVFNDQFDLFAENASRLVDFLYGELGALYLIAPDLGGRAGEWRNHANLHRIGCLHI